MKDEANYAPSIPASSLLPLQLVNWAMESMNFKQSSYASAVICALKVAIAKAKLLGV